MDLQGLLSRYSGYGEPNEEDKKAALNMGLLQAGLGILMGAQPQRGYKPPLGPALGAGGMMGLQGYNQALQQGPANRLRSMQAAGQMVDLEDKLKQREMLRGLQGQFTDPAAGLLATAGDFKGAVERQYPKASEVKAPTTRKIRIGNEEVHQEFDPKTMQWTEVGRGPLKDPSTNVTVQNYPNPIPAVGPDGKLKMVQFGNRGEVIETPYTPPVTPDERRAARDEEKEANRVKGQATRADLVMGKVDEALKSVGPLTVGVPGAITSRIPGTKAYDLNKTVDTIKANIGFQELQEMRAASPTGGALGQVAVKELDFLQATLASLDTNQSEPQIRSNLNAVKTHYNNWKNAVTQAKKESDFPIKAMPPANKHKGQVIEDDKGKRFRSDGMIWKPE